MYLIVIPSIASSGVRSFDRFPSQANWLIEHIVITKFVKASIMKVKPDYYFVAKIRYLYSVPSSSIQLASFLGIYTNVSRWFCATTRHALPYSHHVYGLALPVYKQMLRDENLLMNGFIQPLDFFVAWYERVPPSFNEETSFHFPGHKKKAKLL